MSFRVLKSRSSCNREERCVTLSPSTHISLLRKTPWNLVSVYSPPLALYCEMTLATYHPDLLLSSFKTLSCFLISNSWIILEVARLKQALDRTSHGHCGWPSGTAALGSPSSWAQEGERHRYSTKLPPLDTPPDLPITSSGTNGMGTNPPHRCCRLWSKCGPHPPATHPP